MNDSTSQQNEAQNLSVDYVDRSVASTVETDSSVSTEQPTVTQTAATVNKDKSEGYFNSTRIAFIAIFTAISYVLSLLDFSLLPGTPVTFLKLDFSNVFVMLAGFALGPVSGCIVAVLKELIHALTVGQTAFVGEAANIIFAVSYMIVPAIVYKKHKGIKVVIVTLIIGCLVQCLVSLPVNYLFNFPAFTVAFGGTWEGGHQLFIQTWYWALLFNFIKTAIISVVTIIIYKPLSKLIKLTNKKFGAIKTRKRKQVK